MTFRLIPALIFVAAMMLTVRVGDIWTTLSREAGDDPAASGTAVDAAGGDLSLALGTASAQENGENGENGGDGADGQAGAAPEGMEPIETTDEPAPDFADDEDLRPGELRLMHDLAERRERLEARARELDEREALLAAAEEKLVAKQERLETLRNEIEQLVDRFQDSQKKEASLLRQTYRNMKPKAAAAIFNELEMSTLLDVVRGMPARNLAPILADMAPEKARQVTQELALREELPELPQQ